MNILSTRPARLIAATGVVALAAVSLGLRLASANVKPIPVPMPPLVGVAVAQARDLPLQLDAQGHLVALAQVEVRPQASGIIRTIHFKEGDPVSAGQLMFTIDATDVAAQLARARAAAAQTRALLDEAQRDLARTQQLAKSRYFSMSAVDTSLGKVESLQAQYQAAMADVDNTRVLVDHTRITAPMSGRTGALAVHAGSLAQPGAAAALVNVAQMDPIGVEFTLPEANLADLLAARSSRDLRVSLLDPRGRRLDGKITFVNNTVDTDTATILVKASFANADQALWPGAFVRVQLLAGTSRGAMTVPPQSVMEGPAGRFVYVVDADGKIATRPVGLQRMQDQLAVVTGLSGGERVVTEGQAGLRPGVKVRVAAPAAPVAASAGSPA